MDPNQTQLVLTIAFDFAFDIATAEYRLIPAGSTIALQPKAPPDPTAAAKRKAPTPQTK